MMLIICSDKPDKAVDWLVENTNKNFCFKQLLELGQLICSTYISDVYKPVKQGQELQTFIIKHIEWIYYYYACLYSKCKYLEMNMQQKTKTKIDEIMLDLFINSKLEAKKHKKRYSGYRFGFEVEVLPIKYDLETAIWRYSKEYESEYPTNSELPIEVVTELYKEYIKWKFSV